MHVAEPNQPRGIWPLGRIVSTHPGQDGIVRAVTVRTQYGEYKTPITKLFLRGSGDLQSWTKVLGTVGEYSYLSVIFRLPLKTVRPFRNFLAVLPPPPHPIQS